MKTKIDGESGTLIVCNQKTLVNMAKWNYRIEGWRPTLNAIHSPLVIFIMNNGKEEIKVVVKMGGSLFFTPGGVRVLEKEIPKSHLKNSLEVWYNKIRQRKETPYDRRPIKRIV